MIARARLLPAALLLLAACDTGVPHGEVAPPPDAAMQFGAVPIALTDMQPGQTYHGFPGGLYPDGLDVPPEAHHEAGVGLGTAVTPLNRAGAPDPQNGAIVLLSIGMSNTSQEFCGNANNPRGCFPWTFAGQAGADPDVNPDVTIVNGAIGGAAANSWTDPAGENYDYIRDDVLAARGLSEAQVQVVWLKVANGFPEVSLPDAAADAFALEAALGDIARALRERYPNLKQVFVSSRIFAGYATTELNPEPYAYESGYAVKWFVEAQIEQAETGVVDAGAGDLAYPSEAPWLAWGAYLWAPGPRGRLDGLKWTTADFDADGTHPSEAGEEKVGTLLLDFFKSSPYTRCWFLADGGVCA